MKSEESDDSSSSDNEFWHSFETAQEALKPKENQPKKERFTSLKPSEKERYERTIINIRDSKEEELKNLKITIRNKTKKELFSSINELKLKFQQEAFRLQETFADSRSIIQKKEFEILKLGQTTCEQETLISQMRIFYSKISQKTLPEPESQEDQLKQELQGYKTQIDSLKQVCEEYKLEAEHYKRINERLVEENSILKKKFEDITFELSNFVNENCEKLEKEKKEVSYEFSVFKNEAEKELEVREVLNQRQAQMIISLQEELKNAKIIISTPRIHYKAIERLRDTNDLELSERKIKKDMKPVSFNVNKKNLKFTNNYSYKEYKPFSTENSKAGLLGSRAVSITPRMEMLYQKSSKLSYSNESRQKLSKNSVLYYNKTLED